jgi:hypothetical protein
MPCITRSWNRCIINPTALLYLDINVDVVKELTDSPDVDGSVMLESMLIALKACISRELRTKGFLSFNGYWGKRSEESLTKPKDAIPIICLGLSARRPCF